MVKFFKNIRRYLSEEMLRMRCHYASGHDDLALGELFYKEFGEGGSNYKYYVGIDYELYDTT